MPNNDKIVDMFAPRPGPARAAAAMVLWLLRNFGLVALQSQ